MIAVDLGVTRIDDVIRVVRALGTHRYVAGRLHLIHALCLASVADDAAGTLAEAQAWAAATLAMPAIDPASRDERLWRRGTDAELAGVLDAYWTPGPRAAAARDALRARLDHHGLSPAPHGAFDEAHEEAMHPLAVDAGWELLALGQLDADRHKGAIAAFGDDLEFETARFEEESAIPAPLPHLCELPAIGPAELLAGVSEGGELVAPLVVWVQGDERYLDYVIRGVKRAAKIE